MKSPRPEANSPRPNIIVILADDMGYSDIGCFGSEISTPHLDSMAAKGSRFTQMYNNARCCPTRAGILTGLSPHQAGIGLMVGDRGVGPAYQGFLREDCVTIAEALQPMGYHSCYAGKWHVSPGIPIKGEPAVKPGTPRNPSPLSRGFDRFYGTLAGAGSYFYPHGLMDQDTPIQQESEDYYYTDAISDHACGMIRESVEGEAPFFLHVCYTAPHWPLHALPEDIDTYRNLYRNGWDKIRSERHQRLQSEGLLDPKWDLSPRDEEAPDFLSLSPERQEWEAQRMAVYAAQVESMDRGIGRILETLRDSGEEENTFILFLSDNGGCAEFLNEDGDGHTWPSFYLHAHGPGQTCTVGNIHSLEPGPATTFMSYDLPWANLSNTPFRLYKSWVHEGGISTPMVVQWPKGSHTPNIVRQPCHITDIMSTCLDLAGAPDPYSAGGDGPFELQGESLLPLLQDPSRTRKKPIAIEHQGNCAFRDGPWKLVRRHPDSWELYNMEEDRTELHDLSAEEPERVAALAEAYQAWAERNGVLDWPLSPPPQS